MPTSQPVPLSRPHYSGSTLLSRSECNTSNSDLLFQVLHLVLSQCKTSFPIHHNYKYIL
uniref:Uncharacterized protein n=1 Tax=Anguilla anguilla TaxID=7936 RepID=A0A0E9SYG6_ANGAN